MKEARFWKEVEGGIECELCTRHCNISQGKTGICGVRRNEKNRLYSLNYGLAAPINVDPIGKKPLFHFHPQSQVLSLGTAGCNFRCDYCQNCDISQIKVEKAPTRKITPKKIQTMAKKNRCEGIAWTYNEPTIWYEFVSDAGRYLKKKGFFNVFVTNGYIESEPFKDLAGVIDAVNVDVKSFSDAFYAKIARAHLNPVLETCKLAKEMGMHIEISYLLVPPLNSDPMEIQKMSRWVKNVLGKNTPLHFLRFFPAHRLTEIAATSREALIEAQRIAKMEGLVNVYINNLPGGRFQDTYCPSCGEMVIHREEFYTILKRVTDSKCPKCKSEILMID